MCFSFSVYQWQGLPPVSLITLDISPHHHIFLSRVCSQYCMVFHTWTTTDSAKDMTCLAAGHKIQTSAVHQEKNVAGIRQPGTTESNMGTGIMMTSQELIYLIVLDNCYTGSICKYLILEYFLYKNSISFFKGRVYADIYDVNSNHML